MSSARDQHHILHPTEDVRTRHTIGTRRTLELIRSEHLRIEEGSSHLDVRGSDFDAVLLINGRPLLYHWSDCNGSVGQYLLYNAAGTHSRYCNPLVGLETTIRRERSLLSYVEPLVPVLAPGEYALNYFAAPQLYDVIEFDEHWDVDRDSIGYYPGCGSFVTTGPKSSLSEERVYFFERKIQDGERPLLLTVSVEKGWSDFIIDGHHKLAAYSRLKIPAHYLNIQRRNAPRITQREASAYIPLRHPIRSSWETTKAQFDFPRR